MRLEERPNGNLLIRRIMVEELALLSLCLPLTPDCKRVMDALLAGRRVAITADAPEHKQYRRTAPRAVYQKFVAMERELHALGVVRATAADMGGEAPCW
ncbi:MAG: hypothetical protein HFF09_06900 [Oscillospiraceae bacterium]|nr:hypothetical protein [Oscillospiraceae bacterium]